MLSSSVLSILTVYKKLIDAVKVEKSAKEKKTQWHKKIKKVMKFKKYVYICVKTKDKAVTQNQGQAYQLIIFRRYQDVINKINAREK